MKALSLFKRTSGRAVNLAAWHSPHSLTWSWVLSLTRADEMRVKPFAMLRRDEYFGLAFGAGLGGLLAFHTYRNNGGRQWTASFLWHTLHWHRQRPMWYRNLFVRYRDEADTAQNEIARLHRELGTVRHNAARAAMAETPVHLH